MPSPPPETVGRTLRGVAVSLAFWTCLTVAAACFGAVALSPKYLQHQRLHAELAANQRRLVALERQTLQLKDVVSALGNDPAFAEELARVEFDAVRPGEEVLPVEAKLRLDPRQTAVVEEPSTDEPSANVDPLELRLTEFLILAAQAGEVRTALLLSAATLVILAFTWLHEPTSHAAQPARRTIRDRVRSRYAAE